MLKDFTKEIYDVIVLAGQSNGEGHGVGDIDEPYTPTPSVWALNNDFYQKEEFTIAPATEKARGNEVQSNLGLIFARSYIESGRLAESIHKRLGRASALIKPKDLYFFGEHSDKLMQGALEAGFPAERIITEPSDTNRLADIILDRLAPSELLLVKGSRGVRLERIVDRLMDRGGEEKRDRDA